MYLFSKYFEEIFLIQTRDDNHHTWILLWNHLQHPLFSLWPQAASWTTLLDHWYFQFQTNLVMKGKLCKIVFSILFLKKFTFSSRRFYRILLAIIFVSQRRVIIFITERRQPVVNLFVTNTKEHIRLRSYLVFIVAVFIWKVPKSGLSSNAISQKFKNVLVLHLEKNTFFFRRVWLLIKSLNFLTIRN